MPRQAGIVRSDVKTRAEAAAAQKNEERHYGEQSVHLLDPSNPHPQLMVYCFG
jgi:hypothetical protein